MGDTFFGTHVLNEQNKRLDPIYNRCMCCGQGVSNGNRSDFYISLFKVKDRTDLVVYRNVRFQRLVVGVSRCPKCKAIHKKGERISVIKRLLVGVGTAGVGVLIGFLLEPTSIIGPLVAVFGLVFGIILAFVSFANQPSKVCEKNKVLTQEKAAKQYDLVMSLLKDGWTFIKPTA